MKNLLLFSFGLCLMAFAACNKQNIVEVDPTTVVAANTALISNFSIDNLNQTVNEKEQVLLSNKSLNATSYLWDFGNGVTSTDKNPAFAYQKCGIYSIALTVTGADGTQKTSTRQITSLCIFGGPHGSN